MRLHVVSASFAGSFLCAAALIAPAFAQKAALASGPLAGLTGAWSGAGVVARANGERERIRCRAHYDVGAGGARLRQRLDCASQTYRLSLQGDMSVDENGSIAGSWSEATRNAGGTLSGRASPGRITGMIEGTGFAGAINVATRGDRQSVSLRSQGEVRAVDVTLRRAAAR